MLRDHSETRLHMAVVNYLNGKVRSGRNFINVQAPFPGLIWLHPVNEFKDKKEAFWGQAKGIMLGAADLLFWWKKTPIGKPYFDYEHPIIQIGAIELKTVSYLTESQKTFEGKFKAIGGYYAVCRRVAEVRDTLISWGLQCKNTACHEPRASLADQQAAYMEMLRPHD